ncbi:autophagy-related protein 13-domain-containing protein [Mycena metata]|uniref:Autophagy-related protein 13 n=1 Tax=Mycena metata TaxID=1033252 RepID=A0AAD7DEN1_9AGAR|nr:autophagy-related protein 13-domain-containing protein [Mycena metata]
MAVALGTESAATMAAAADDEDGGEGGGEGGELHRGSGHHPPRDHGCCKALTGLDSTLHNPVSHSPPRLLALNPSARLGKYSFRRRERKEYWTISTRDSDSTKADQIAFHIYTKLFHVLYAARASEQGVGAVGKADKWFNLETALAPALATPTLELDSYRALSSSSGIKPLAIQVLLVVPPPGGGTALVHKASGTRVEPEPRYVLLEEWVLGFSSTSTSISTSSTSDASSSSSSSAASDTTASGGSSTSEETDADVLPSTIYKNAIPLFRALFALLRILPAWRVVRKLTSRKPTTPSSTSTTSTLGAAGERKQRGLRVIVRLRPDAGEERGEATLLFGQSPAPESGAAPLATSTHVFPGIRHPAAQRQWYLLPMHGEIEAARLKVTIYARNVEFHLRLSVHMLPQNTLDLNAPEPLFCQPQWRILFLLRLCVEAKCIKVPSKPADASDLENQLVRWDSWFLE